MQGVQNGALSILHRYDYVMEVPGARRPCLCCSRVLAMSLSTYEGSIYIYIISMHANNSSRGHPTMFCDTVALGTFPSQCSYKIT